MASLDFDRYHARSIKNAILAENPRARIRVEKGKLITSEFTEKQRQLATGHKEELIAYLTTPPPIGMCMGGHKTEWILTKHGDWVCSCYREKHLRALVSFKSNEDCLSKLF